MTVILVWAFCTSTLISVALGVLCYLSMMESRKARAECTESRVVMLKILYELERIRGLAKPMPIRDDASIVPFKSMLGAALASYDANPGGREKHAA